MFWTVMKINEPDAIKFSIKTQNNKEADKFKTNINKCFTEVLEDTVVPESLGYKTNVIGITHKINATQKNELNTSNYYQTRPWNYCQQLMNNKAQKSHSK